MIVQKLVLLLFLCHAAKRANCQCSIVSTDKCATFLSPWINKASGSQTLHATGTEKSISLSVTTLNSKMPNGEDFGEDHASLGNKSSKKHKRSGNLWIYVIAGTAILVILVIMLPIVSFIVFKIRTVKAKSITDNAEKDSPSRSGDHGSQQSLTDLLLENMDLYSDDIDQKECYETKNEVKNMKDNECYATIKDLQSSDSDYVDISAYQSIKN